MQEIILIKQSPAIQLAHLYEHLFCSAVDKLFYARGLFPYLDYTLTGKTHQAGIIYIKLETYTSKACELLNRLADVKIDLSDTSLTIASNQLIAEKQFAYDGSSAAIVTKALKELEDVPWLDLDALTSIDTHGMRRVSMPYYIATTHPLPAKKLTVELAIDKDFIDAFRELTPLFRLVCFLISDTYEMRLMDKFGVYSLDGIYLSTKYRSLFRVAPNSIIDHRALLDEIVAIITYISTHKGFKRLANELSRTSYKSLSRLAPDPLQNLTDTRILQGSVGWQQIAASAHIEQLLSHLEISIKFGGVRISQTANK